MRIPRPVTCVLLSLGGCLILCGPCVAAEEVPSPVAWYSFDEEGALGADVSGTGQMAGVTGGTPGAGRVGNGLWLDKTGGLQVPASESLHATEGLTIDCWVRFADVRDNANIVSKEGEYLLRLDPPGEGGTVSFFVDLDGALEPRVTGPAVQPGRWYHLVATWDGATAVLWVNGQEFSRARSGNVTPTQTPVSIGLPSQWGPVGLHGIVDEVKLYDRALPRPLVLTRDLGLDRPVEGPRATEARFEFETDTEGWEIVGEGALSVRDGALRANVPPEGATLLRRALAVPLADKPFVSLRMALSTGTEATLLYLTDSGLGATAFPVEGDGRMHSYALDLSEGAGWRDTLEAVGLVPPAGAEAAIDFLRVAQAPEGPPEIGIERFLLEPVIPRAGVPLRVNAALKNTGGNGAGLTARLRASRGVTVLEGSAQTIAQLGFGEEVELSWEVQAAGPVTSALRLQVSGEGMTTARRELEVSFLPPLAATKADYVPEPQIAHSKYLIGAHYCPLWKQGSRSGGWELIEPYPEREPALSWYDEDNPEVTDWEIKYALEHGISYFVYCWYRGSQGGPVDVRLGHAIHDGLFQSRYGSKFQFAIMWENQGKGTAGVSSEEDLLHNLLPYWIENYFKHPSYLKVDGKPLLFIYRPEFLVGDLGSVEKVRSALDKVRRACVDAGLGGLTILGEDRGKRPEPLRLMKSQGLDASFSYCWPIAGNPEPQQAIAAQEDFWRERRQMGIIPDLVTISMGWDSRPWHSSSTIWRLPPDDFETLCQKAREFMDELPADEPGSRLVLLDNWNEFGEGHYIFPHREHGFGYLDAVRNAFCDGAGPHTDLVPEDLGLGPYTRRYDRFKERRARCAEIVVAEDLEPDLIGYWSFDEPDDVQFAWDWSGNGLGGMLDDATRVPGRRGRALKCEGGCVQIPGAGARFALDEISVECWVKTDVAGQSDKWFVNNLYGSGTSGFRLGLGAGRLEWAIPKAPWSHRLSAADPLPTGRWVHVAATYDGKVMRLYMDGRQCASLERRGPVVGNASHLCLGSYDVNHRAYFDGLLDEVKILRRALSSEEIAARAQE